MRRYYQGLRRATYIASFIIILYLFLLSTSKNDFPVDQVDTKIRVPREAEIREPQPTESAQAQTTSSSTDNLSLGSCNFMTMPTVTKNEDLGSTLFKYASFYGISNYNKKL